MNEMSSSLGLDTPTLQAVSREWKRAALYLDGALCAKRLADICKAHVRFAMSLLVENNTIDFSHRKACPFCGESY